MAGDDVSDSRDITLGVHVGHDAAAAVVADSRLVYAEEEERHTRRKSQDGCPWNALAAALAAASASASDVRTIALTWNLSRYLECRRDLAEHARRIGNQEWHEKRQREIAIVRDAVEELRRRFPKAAIVDVPHHHAHVACAVSFGAPGAGPVLGVVADALGDAESVTVFSASDDAGLLGSPEVVLRRSPQQSIGFFYKRASEVFGFSGSEACGYLMSLSGCGDGREAADLLRDRLVTRGDQGLSSFTGDFDPFRGHSESAARCFPEDLLGRLQLPARAEDAELLARAAQANAFQRITEEYLEELLRHLVRTHRPRTVFLSGGVFLNCVALERLTRAIPDVEWVVCPVKKDSGTAIGAAVVADVARNGPRVLRERPRTLRLGTTITGDEDAWSTGRHEIFGGREEVVAQLAGDLAAGNLVALADGAGEFGPRALGARSILATPSSRQLATHLNGHVKSRHSFQPFAGAFLEEEFRRVHPGKTADAFMSYAVRFGEESRESLAGILHRDGSSRAQLVTAGEDSILRSLLLELARRDLPAVVLNTSLNARGEPMPRTAAEARATCAGLGIERIYTPKGRWTP